MIGRLEEIEDAVTLEILRKSLLENDVMREIMNHLEKGYEKPSKKLIDAGYKNEIMEMSKSAGHLLMKGDRFLIPEELRSSIPEAAHEGHPGRDAMLKQMRLSVWWP